MTNPAAIDPTLATEILDHAQHLFSARRAGPFHVQPGEPIQAVVEPAGLFADPLQFLLQSLDLSAVLRNVAPTSLPAPPTSGFPLPPGLPSPTSPPPAILGSLNSVFDAVTDISKIQPRLRVAVRWTITRVLDTSGGTEQIEEWNIDVDDPGSLSSAALNLRFAPTRAFPLRIPPPDEPLPIGDVLCVRPTITLTLDERRLEVPLPGILTHVLPVLLPTVLVLAPHPNFGPDKDQPIGIAVPADSPINSLEALQDVVARLRSQLQPRGIGRFALWAAGLGFLVDLLKLPNPLVFVKGMRMDKLDDYDFTDKLNDKANSVALFGAPGAAVTLSSRDRVGSAFSAQGGGDPGLLHLRVGQFGYVACQDLEKRDTGAFHARNAPRGELLPPEATLAHPSGANSNTVDAPGPDLVHPGTITVVETDSKGHGFQDSLTAWTFEDINPRDGSPFPAPPQDPVTNLGRFRCPDSPLPLLQQFRRGRWKTMKRAE
ncbi:MAG TPA: hypothetical protein VF121_14085 [Thermoanaerobaculia bacterium]|nr:hypothetical protein [Thermoanaerobaculia bacterium]